jgi:hypothetical protein
MPVLALMRREELLNGPMLRRAERLFANEQRA